jgi:hypothetical protein
MVLVWLVQRLVAIRGIRGGSVTAPTSRRGRGEMSEPTLSLAVGVGDVAAGGVCEKHTILFPLSHTGGLFHPYKHVCPFCRAERAEARVKVLEELAAALDDLLCAYRVGGQEWGARAADRVRRARAEKRIIAARAALRGEEQGK